MKYREYEGYTKAYVLVHNTGFGVQEAPYTEHEVVYETDDWEDAILKSQELKIQNNDADAVTSSWCDNTYHVNVNTLSEKGKQLLEEFKVSFDKRLKDVGRYNMVKVGDMTYCTDKTLDKFFETPEGPALQSHSFIILDTSNDTPKNEE